jgi:hypothetical protein
MSRLGNEPERALKRAIQTAILLLLGTSTDVDRNLYVHGSPSACALLHMDFY